MQQGETLVCRGETLTPVTLGILLSAGIQSVNVYAAPRVLFLPTGDELVPSGGPVPPGKNVESNSLLISAMLRQFGCKPAVGGILPDSPSELETALLQGALQADLVIIGAGSSKGNKDFTMDVPGKHRRSHRTGNRCRARQALQLDPRPGHTRFGHPRPSRRRSADLPVLCTGRSGTADHRKAAGHPKSFRHLDSGPPRQMDRFYAAGTHILGGGPAVCHPHVRLRKDAAANRRAFLQVLYCPKDRHFHAGEQVAVEFPLLRGPF